MENKLGPIEVKWKTGSELFQHQGKDQGFALTDFWSWSTSDLVINITRGVLAEFIVAQALHAADKVRIEWAPLDIQTPDGISVEVKSAAYLQSWEQKKLSTIQFNYEKTTPIDDEKGGYRGEPRRAAQVYVFSLLKERDKSKVDPLKLEQWDFYVVPTATLNVRERSQQSITLYSLEKERDKLKVELVDFFGLEGAVKRAASIKSPAGTA